MNATELKDKALDESRMINMVRNALLVAGHELGPSGDHWPAIKATIYDIMKEWEEVQVERNVDAELKSHLYQQLEGMEKDLPNCADAVRDDIRRELGELRESYDAYFAPLEIDTLASPTDLPILIQRAKAIIATLEEQDD